MDIPWETLVGLFLIAHGLVHASVMMPPAGTPGKQLGWTGRSWLLTRGVGESASRNVGVALGALAMIGFVGAGLGYMGVDALVGPWRSMAVYSAIISLVFAALAFPDLKPNPLTYLAWPLIDLGVIVSLTWAWP